MLYLSVARKRTSYVSSRHLPRTIPLSAVHIIIICPRRQLLPSTHHGPTTLPRPSELHCNIRCRIKRVQDTRAFISLSFVLLTAAHVVCTPTRGHISQWHQPGYPRERIVALGNMDHQHATSGIMAALGLLAQPFNHSVPRMRRLLTSGSRTNSRWRRRRRIDHLNELPRRGY